MMPSEWRKQQMRTQVYTTNEDSANDTKWMKKTDVELLYNLENSTMGTIGTALYSLMKSFFN